VSDHGVAAKRLHAFFVTVQPAESSLGPEDRLTLRAAVLTPDGSRRVADHMDGPAADAECVGRRLAERMLAAGAREVLAMR